MMLGNGYANDKGFHSRARRPGRRVRVFLEEKDLKTEENAYKRMRLFTFAGARPAAKYQLCNSSYKERFVHTAMALYINGRPVNPIVQFLVSAVVLAAVVGIGILLLPVIGGILLFVLICVAALALYGVYWRWRHGDPLENLRKRMQEEMRAQEDAEDRVAEARAPEEGLKPGDKAQAGVKRTTVVEDAVVVEEIKRIPRDTQQ